MEPIILASPAEVAERAAHVIAGVVRARAARRERTSLMLAGGTTPRAAYERLAAMEEVPLDTVDFDFGDERAVPSDHTDSNYRMAKEALFERCAIPAANVHRMLADSEDQDAAARAYDADLPNSIDILILGMGEDGHTASLFPGSKAIGERDRRIVPVIGPKPPPKRLTITPPVIESAARVVVLVTGEGKADALRRALEGPFDPAALPIQLARRGELYADAKAASQLSRTLPNGD